MKRKTSKVIDQYLSDVLSQIAPTSLKEDISHEIECHLDESVEAGMEFGLNEEQATLVAIEKMGPPSDLGKKLAEIHRPRLNWAVIGPAVGLVLVGLLAMHSIGRLGGQLIFGLLGIVLAGLLTFTDFSKLKRLAPALYILSLVGVVLAMLFGPQYLGQPYLFLGPLRIKIMDAGPFLFIVALGGMITKAKWTERKSAILLLCAILLAQVLFFATNSLPSLVLFVVAAVTVMHASGARDWQTSIIGFTGIVLLILMSGSDSFVSSSNFMAIQASESHTDYVLSYLLGAFGKGMGVLALAGVLWLSMQLVDCIKAIKAETPKLVVIGIATLLGSEFAWSILANLGWAPMPTVGLNFPLLSFGGTLLVIHLASIGLTLSAYRRKTLRVV